MADKNFKQQLVAAYDADAKRRVDNGKARDNWKLAARQAFADLAESEDKKTILELGAGAGLDSTYFKSRGFDVLATDMSPKMVEACQEAGLAAQALDLYDLGQLHRQFDAIYSMNVLLHVPKEDLGEVLATIHDTLTPDGIFFYGVYGGIERETIFTDPKQMNLPRFFSFLDDDTLHAMVSPLFEVVDSKAVDVGEGDLGLHFQSFLLRRK
jgi:2-polyprenyl-3-methyl-5-hydroxy-6-metoxy-1,4-benzoquinol methylase